MDVKLAYSQLDIRFITVELEWEAGKTFSTTFSSTFGNNLSLFDCEAG
jgi:hypothetical protein